MTVRGSAAPESGAMGMRSLVEVVVAAAGLDEDPARCGLVALGPTLLTPDGQDVLLDAAATAVPCRVFRSAAALRRAGAELRTLLLVRSPPDGAGTPARVAVVDGWSAVRDAGARADLREADLRGAALAGARLEGTDLSAALLERVDLTGANLRGAILRGADLRGACLRRANLQGADLSEADLRRADLGQGDLRDATLRRCALRGAELFAAYVWHVDFSTALTDGVDLERADHRGSHAT